MSGLPVGAPQQVRPRKGFRQVKGGGMSVAQAESLMKQRQHLYMNRIQENEGGMLEGDIVDTSRNHLGSDFRSVFFIVMGLIVFAMMFVKLGGEMIEPPNRDKAEKDEIDQYGEDAASKLFEMRQKEREHKAAKESKQEAALRRKRELKEAEDARKAAEEQLASNTCDAECKKSAIALRDVGNQLSHVVVTDYYEALEIKSGLGGASRQEINEKFQEVKEKIEKEDESVKHLDLAELQEARDVLMNNEARMYYNLYGMRPPATMRVFAGSARHGGWGQEFHTQAWKVKKLLGWMQYFDSASLDLGILGFIAFTTVLPVVLNFRNLVRTMKHAFPDLDPDTAADYEKKMAALRKKTLSRR